jgi:hypothetical protein
MNARGNTQERVAVVLRDCTARLQEEPFAHALPALGKYAEPGAAFELLSSADRDVLRREELRHLCVSASSDVPATTVERTLLMLTCQHTAGQIPGLPVADRVKELFVNDFEFFVSPSEKWLPHFRNDDVRYREMARIATLRRFPAGQFHWEIAGFPRSWLVKTPRVWSLLWHIVGRMGGFSPVFEFHLNERRKNRLLLLEKEGNLSFYSAARTLEKQPGVKGIMLASWLFSEETAQVSPHLAWLRRIPESAGAFLIDLGPASPDSGFLTGSIERRKLYEQGSYRPKFACVLWPRSALISWANKHPEFDR